MNKDLVLFKKANGKNVTFEDLMRNIYENSELRREHMLATADHIKEKIQTTNDAILLLSGMVELQKAAIKNDDQLIALASIVQRATAKISVASKEQSFGMSAEDRRLLLEQAKSYKPIPGQSSGDE